jgi:hypothetical protein
LNLPRPTRLGCARVRLAVPSLIAAAALIAMTPPAYSAEIDVGNPDAALRWDNSLRYNLGARVERQNDTFLANPNIDDGNRNFEKGQVVANRLDLLSELDLVFQKKYGVRLSAAAWYDDAYRNLSGDSPATSNTLVNGAQGVGLSDYTKRYAKGPSGEFLDAFVFGNFSVGDVPISVRAGRHTVIWGEALLDTFQGVSYGQGALDFWKAVATPGTEAKELFRPRNQISVQAQPTTELTLAAQVFLGWEGTRYAESGTYLNSVDFFDRGGQILIVPGVGNLRQGSRSNPNKSGDFGVSARWSPAWVDGTLGFYARRSADVQSQFVVSPLAGQYRAFYGRDIDILGLSLSKSVAGVSVGAELSHRRNMPLNSNAYVAVPGAAVPLVPGSLNESDVVEGEAPGARGNTLHGVFNLVGSVSKTALFDNAFWIAELVWNRWVSVTHNEALFKGNAAYRADPGNIDAVTKNYFGFGLSFTPTWFQVMPGVDVSMPLAWSGGLSGVSAIANAGNEKSGSYTIGVGATVNSVHNFSLRYTDYYGKLNVKPSGEYVYGGSNASLTDRGAISLTYKTTF